LRKPTLFVFLSVLSKFSIVFKKFSRLRLSFQETVFSFDCLLGLCQTTNNNKSNFPISVGKKVGERKARLGQKSKSKKPFFGFYTKTVADTRFWSAPWKRTQKMQPE